MTYQDFIGRLQEKTGLDDVGADRAAHAVLGTLAERLTDEEASNLSAQLPQELAGYMSQAALEPRLKGSIGDFYERIGEAEGTDLETATTHARAVWEVLEPVHNLASIPEIAGTASESLEARARRSRPLRR